MSITITQEYECFSSKRLMRFSKYLSMYGNVYQINKGPENGGIKETPIITKDIANRIVKLQDGPSIKIDGERHVVSDVYINGMQAWQEVADNVRRYDFGEDKEFALRMGLGDEIEMRAVRLEMDIQDTLDEEEPGG